jgi:predicted HicB family RNase H-like nuclease
MILGLTNILIKIICISKLIKGVINKMTTINIKDFPDDLHRKAKSEAALMGISLKEFIIRAMTEYLKKKKGG